MDALKKEHERYVEALLVDSDRRLREKDEKIAEVKQTAENF